MLRLNLQYILAVDCAVVYFAVYYDYAVDYAVICYMVYY